MLPKYASCRPIYVEDSIREAGFEIVKEEEMMINGNLVMNGRQMVGEITRTEQLYNE